MEYTPHGSLLDLMSVRHLLNESEASNYFLQILNALDFCHSRFIAHRDLKLENMLMFWRKNDFHRLKVGDFGFCRYFNTADPTTTLSKTFCGSDAYIRYVRVREFSEWKLLPHSCCDLYQSFFKSAQKFSIRSHIIHSWPTFGAWALFYLQRFLEDSHSKTLARLRS